MLPTMSRFIRPSGFKGEDFFKSANQKQELPMAAMFVNGRPLSFHILIFSSETPRPNEVKLGRKHLWNVLSKDCFLHH
jgi:hypothetical protein